MTDAFWTGGLLIAAVVIGMVATLGGFAGLADPRTARFLAPQRPLHQTWDSWTPGEQRPASDPAPVDGYTVP
ncbi:hypothetical protein [Dactylosporangium sp. NPDC005555]|uniref:hypothetical protein n=1 Tax=Dactylosporangium sp. NPDC005555 TaxID=3154889 RepID=UPI0033A35562